MKNYPSIFENIYMDGETFLLTLGSIIIHKSKSNSQPIWLELVVRISKFLRKGLSIIKMYHSYFKCFHHSNVRFLTHLK